MQFRFNKLVNKIKSNTIASLAIALIVVVISMILLSLPTNDNTTSTPPVQTKVVNTIATFPVSTPAPTTTLPATTTTTLPDLSGVDFVQLARDTYGKCGEFHDLAIQVGWPEEEWEHLSIVMWRESRCQTDAWNGADGGLTQINQIHSAWLADMGWSHPEDMFDPEKNLTFALRLWETSGWKPWKSSGSTFNS